jgi:hypothetical protein
MDGKRGSVIPILQIMTALGIVLFWIGFFTIGLAPETPPPCYFAFEHSFPLPDILLAFTIFSAAVLLLKGHRLGRTLSLASSGALIFLGLLDFSFNIQNGMYAISVADTILNGFINGYCVMFGIVVILRLQRDKGRD